MATWNQIAGGNFGTTYGLLINGTIQFSITASAMHTITVTGDASAYSAGNKLITTDGVSGVVTVVSAIFSVATTVITVIETIATSLVSKTLAQTVLSTDTTGGNIGIINFNVTGTPIVNCSDLNVSGTGTLTCDSTSQITGNVSLGASSFSFGTQYVGLIDGGGGAVFSFIGTPPNLGIIASVGTIKMSSATLGATSVNLFTSAISSGLLITGNFDNIAGCQGKMFSGGGTGEIVGNLSMGSSGDDFANDFDLKIDGNWSNLGNCRISNSAITVHGTIAVTLDLANGSSLDGGGTGSIIPGFYSSYTFHGSATLSNIAITGGYFEFDDSDYFSQIGQITAVGAALTVGESTYGSGPYTKQWQGPNAADDTGSWPNVGTNSLTYTAVKNGYYRAVFTDSLGQVAVSDYVQVAVLGGTFWLSPIGLTILCDEWSNS